MINLDLPVYERNGTPANVQALNEGQKALDRFAVKFIGTNGEQLESAVIT